MSAATAQRKTRNIASTSEAAPNLLQWSRARAYVNVVGVPKVKRDAAAEQIANLLAVAEGEPDAVAYPEKKPRRKKRDYIAERSRAAAVFKDPTNLEKLQAAFADGPRISSIIPELIAEPKRAWDIRGAVVKSARDFAALNIALRTPYVETLKVAFLNRADVVIHSEILSIGSVTAALMHPLMIARALQSFRSPDGAKRVIISHNHPSGVVDPSAPDVQVTRVISEACRSLDYELVDHVITNGDTFFSFRESGMISTSSPRNVTRARPKTLGLDVKPGELGALAPWEVVGRGELPNLSQPEKVSAMLNVLKQVDPSAAYLFILNRKNRLLSLERVTGFAQRSEMTDMKRRLFAGLGREGGSAFIVGLPDLPASAATAVLRSFRDYGKAIDAECLDIFSPALGSKDGLASARTLGLFESAAPAGKNAADKKHAAAKRRFFIRIDRLKKQHESDEIEAAELEKALLAAIADMDGPDRTGVPLRVEAREYVAGRGDRAELERRANAHVTAPRLPGPKRDRDLARER